VSFDGPTGRQLLNVVPSSLKNARQASLSKTAFRDPSKYGSISATEISTPSAARIASIWSRPGQ
jgi:hypothetical protein